MTVTARGSACNPLLPPTEALLVSGLLLTKKIAVESGHEPRFEPLLCEPPADVSAVRPGSSDVGMGALISAPSTQPALSPPIPGLGERGVPPLAETAVAALWSFYTRVPEPSPDELDAEMDAYNKAAATGAVAAEA